MSDFIRTLNLIKAQRDLTWLTPSQQEALASLKEALRVPGTINLSGATGVGKTFLAWTLADILGYTYFSHPSHFEQVAELSAKGVILDNCQPDRRSHRNMLTALGFRNVRYAVLITRAIIDDYTHSVILRLTPGDKTKVQDNLASLDLFRKSGESFNLWNLVNPHL